MKRYKKTLQLRDLIEDSAFNSVASKNKIGHIIKHSTIFSFWDNIVGSKFSRHTKPYAIKVDKLYVSAKSPVIVQELNLYKTKLLTKVNSYSKPLGIEINDIIFNYKNFCATNPITNNSKEDIPQEIQKSEIENVVLDDKTKLEFKEKIEKLNFLNNNQKSTLLNKILDAKRASIIQNKED